MRSDHQEKQETKKTQNTKETQENPSDDSNAAASKVSQVSGEKKFNSAIHWIVGLVVLFIVLMMVFSGRHSKARDTSHEVMPYSEDYSAQLRANLAKLQDANQQAQTQLGHLETWHQNTETSKAMIARQHAPTNLYSAAPPSSTSIDDAVNTEEAPFAGKSADDHFANQHPHTSSISATQIMHPRYTVASGEFIHAALETAIHSALPGMIRAVITRPVYAYLGERPLIPAGSRLMGQYSSALLQGQNCVMIIWNRIVLPNGIAIQVNSPGSDALGRAGQGADSVNTHFFARFGEAALLSVIGAGVANYNVQPMDQYNSASSYRQAIAQSFQESAQNSLQHTLPMKPTLHIHQGANVTVFVAHDLSFYHVLRTHRG